MRLKHFSYALAFATALLLAGCETAGVGSSQPPVYGSVDGTIPNNATVGAYPTLPPVTSMPMPGSIPGGDMVTAQPIGPAPVRVAILVPETGPSAALGTALLQAAQLAVFDLNEKNFQLVPKDTQGTPEGAASAVQSAAADGVKLILGPLFAAEVTAAKSAARSYGLPIIEFSTDWRLAGDNVYSMGVLPFGQAERMADYAGRQGLRRIGIIATSDAYGDAVIQSFQQQAQRAGMQIVKTVRINADGTDAVQGVQTLTNNQAMTAGRMPFDALFMPVGGSALHVLATTLKQYGLGSSQVRYLGTGLWDDPSVTRDPAMAGAVYSAPSPQIRAAFERNYQRIYGSTPPRLASIGYDSAALAIVLSRNASAANRPLTYDRASLTDPNGFSGVDGIFRFDQNGLAERGMAILQITGGSVHLVEPAPATFQGN